MVFGKTILHGTDVIVDALVPAANGESAISQSVRIFWNKANSSDFAVLR
jgi:hypothetical protein